MWASYLLKRGWQEHEGTATTQDMLFTRHYIVIFILYLRHLRTSGTPRKILAWSILAFIYVYEGFHVQNCKVNGNRQAENCKEPFCSQEAENTCRLWDSGQEPLDHLKKTQLLFEQSRSATLDKETQQTLSVKPARKVEAIFNTVLCVMQVFPHESRETQSTKDVCVCK